MSGHEYLGKIPEGLNYTKEHEWVKLEGRTAKVGITDYAQHALTDIVFVELPEAGKKAVQFKPLCVVESVKSVSDIFSPISGEVARANESLKEKPESINNDPYGEGWIAEISISDSSELNKLMDSAQYRDYLEAKKK